MQNNSNFYKKNYHVYSIANKNNNFYSYKYGPYEEPKEEIYEEETYAKPQAKIHMMKSYQEEEKDKQKKYKVIDFDYSLLKPYLLEADKRKENIILLSTGSYNPIHKMHIEILNIAYRYLLSLKKYNIICGFISPSADCYVRSKNKQLPLIPFDLRCKMIETGIREYNRDNKGNNLKIFLHKWEGTHDYFIDFPDVISEIQAQILDHYNNIKLIYVCGLDLYLACNEYFNKNVIVIDRKPYKNYIYKNIPEKFIYFINDDKVKPYSSTFIRECYLKRDYVGICNITFPEVGNMLIKFYDDNFKRY